MTPRELQLLDARRRARSIRTAASDELRRALIRRLLFDLRESLRRPPPARPTP